MTALRDVLVVSDLDGTLLDHETYSWQAARPALRLLRKEGAGLILASSKTAAEMVGIRDEIGFTDWPNIVENGEGILEPGPLSAKQRNVYEKLRAALATLPSGFRGFGDMDAQEVSDRTGLPLAAAERARQRLFSEPGLWLGADSDLNGFLTAAHAAGLIAQRGGRFLTLSFGGTKADRVKDLIQRFRPKHMIVLGDAPNDVDMIALADSGVIVANPASPDLPKLPGEATGRIRRTTRPGPEGWSDAVLDIVHGLEEMEDKRANG